MEHMKGCHLKRFFPALAWGVSCIFFLLVILFTCYEYVDYRSLCNIGLVEDGIDELHDKLLSVAVGALVCLFVIACVGLVWSLRTLRKLRKSKVRPLKVESMDAALKLLRIDTFGRRVVYGQNAVQATPRVLLFLDKLVQKEDHTLSLEELGKLFGIWYLDKTESSHSLLRNIKCKVRQALLDTPFDVVKDASGNFKLVLKEGSK